MKKLLLKSMPGIFLVTVTCCGGGNSGSISDSFRAADYTKYKAEQAQKIELFSGKR
jgi:hypothetical protein